MAAVNKSVNQYNLSNVTAVLAAGCPGSIEDNAADVILAFDMFHMVKEPQPFLKELHRLIKEKGRLLIDPGHQPKK